MIHKWSFKSWRLFQVAHVSFHPHYIALFCIHSFLTLFYFVWYFLMCLNKIFIMLILDFSILGIIYCFCPMGNKDISHATPFPNTYILFPHIFMNCYNFLLNSYLLYCAYMNICSYYYSYTNIVFDLITYLYLHL